MINKEEFLKTCNLTEDDLTAARISWEELTEIYEDYMSKTKLFRHLGKEFVDEYIYDIERAGIHSYRYRTKNPMHLLEKTYQQIELPQIHHRFDWYQGFLPLPGGLDPFS